MKTRAATIKWGSLCAITAILLVLCIINIFYYIKVSAETTEETGDISVDTEHTFFDGHYTYAKETCYTGSPYLADELFMSPFQRTDSYISNNDFISQIGVENASMFAEKSKDMIEALFDMSYQERDANDPALEDALTDGLHVLFSNDTLTESKKETVERINEWFINNQISMESQFYTDKCMVFFDESKVIVRGQMVFSIYGNGDTDILREHFGLDSLEPGGRYSVLLELEYISKSNACDYNSYKLCGISRL